MVRPAPGFMRALSDVFPKALTNALKQFESAVQEYNRAGKSTPPKPN